MHQVRHVAAPTENTTRHLPMPGKKCDTGNSTCRTQARTQGVAGQQDAEGRLALDRRRPGGAASAVLLHNAAAAASRAAVIVAAAAAVDGGRAGLHTGVRPALQDFPDAPQHLQGREEGRRGQR